MTKIAYYTNNNKNKLYINLIENYSCTNNCVFCDSKILEKEVGNNLLLGRKPDIKKIISEVKTELETNKKIKEIVICGIGEPTLYLKNMIQLIKEIKNEYAFPIRLNTNGQAQLINQKIVAVNELRRAGLDIVSVSMNAVTSEEYEKLHNPNFPGAFSLVIKFAQECDKAGIKTLVSFIEFPYIDKRKIEKFVESIGLTKEQIKYRKYMQ